MKRLFVWLRGASGGVHLAGELVTTELESNGRFDAEFAYAPEWRMQAPDTFALDPVSLPLQPAGQRFQAELLYPPLAVFDDALPDDWGRRLLSTALKLEGRRSTPPEMLLRMRGGGTGALVFTEQPAPPDIDTTVQSTALPALLTAATKFDAGTLPPDAQFRQLLQGSSRAGGARPKALVHDKQGEWLVKFPSSSRDEGHDVVGLEATCLELARQAGLQVPRSRLQSVGRRRILLVERFDVTPESGRIHMVSMRTICKERPGIHVHDYSRVAQALVKYSAAPAADVAMLYRQMVFNAAIGNVDDHLKNFWMLATPAGYRLAPAFDLVPDISGRVEHTLAFQHAFGCPTHDELLAIAQSWGIKEAKRIVKSVVAAGGKFDDTLRKLKVGGGKKLHTILDDVRRRLRLIDG